MVQDRTWTGIAQSVFKRGYNPKYSYMAHESRPNIFLLSKKRAFALSMFFLLQLMYKGSHQITSPPTLTSDRPNSNTFHVFP